MHDDQVGDDILETDDSKGATPDQQKEDMNTQVNFTEPEDEDNLNSKSPMVEHEGFDEEDLLLLEQF